MKCLLFSIFTILLFYSFGQSTSESVDYVFDSEIFQEERTVSVFLPVEYNSGDSTQEFAVAYLFDAQFQPYFAMVTSMMSYYEQSNEGIPVIVVGIHSKDRWGEFVPVPKDQDSSTTAGANKLTQFLTREVFPLIDTNYRSSNFSIGVGHSLGGTYVINEIFQENSIFNAVIAVSPNLTMYDEQILTDATTFLNNNPENRRFIYASVGTEGAMELDFKTSVMRLDSICTATSFEHMYWKFDLLQNENHMTTFVPTFNSGYLDLSSQLMLLDEQLVAMADNFSLSIEENLITFYNDLSTFSGKSHALSVDILMKHASTLSQYGRHKSCAEICQLALERLENENLSTDKKSEVKEMIESRLQRAEFNQLVENARTFALSEDYTSASEIYIKAFDMNVIRGTHLIRMDAVPVLAQAGKLEAAFTQLDLLANTFELGSNGRFIKDPRCEPLHKDKRWEQLMTKLAENGELYK